MTNIEYMFKVAYQFKFGGKNSRFKIVSQPEPEPTKMTNSWYNYSALGIPLSIYRVVDQ